MGTRLDLAVSKHCDAVEPDNVDGYSNNTGFPLTAANQLAYNRWLADAAHVRNLGVVLKNDIDQITALEPDFDFAINEQCRQYNECSGYSAFINNNKAVFQVEYKLTTSQFCPQANVANRDAMLKDLDLTATRMACRTYTTRTPTKTPIIT
jgi:hypothetical protein